MVECRFQLETLSRGEMEIIMLVPRWKANNGTEKCLDMPIPA